MRNRYTRLTLFIVYRRRAASFVRRQGNTFTGLVSIFQYKRSAELIFRVASRERDRRPRFRRDRDTAVHCFYGREIGTPPNCARLLQLLLAKELRTRRKGGTQRRLGDCFFLFPLPPPSRPLLQTHFRYKFSRKCNGSDLQSAANWPEAVMIRCQ